MKTHIQKWGNSLALRIPKTFARELGLEADHMVEISLRAGMLVLEPIEENYTLEGLLAQINQDNLHGEADTGSAVGNEVW